MNLFENAERLLRIAVDTDAWIANRRLNYSSIEGSLSVRCLLDSIKRILFRF